MTQRVYTLWLQSLCWLTALSSCGPTFQWQMHSMVRHAQQSCMDESLNYVSRIYIVQRCASDRPANEPSRPMCSAVRSHPSLTLRYSHFLGNKTTLEYDPLYTKHTNHSKMKETHLFRENVVGRGNTPTVRNGRVFFPRSRIATKTVPHFGWSFIFSFHTLISYSTRSPKSGMESTD